MNYYLPTQYPTPEQEKWNNGMTELKLRILRLRCNTNDLQRKDGYISSAQSLESTRYYIGQILVLQGKEPAYLQG